MQTNDSEDDRRFDADATSEAAEGATLGCCRYDVGATGQEARNLTRAQCIAQAQARGGTNVRWTPGGC